MGASKKDFEEIREYCTVEMPLHFYERHEDLLKENSKLKSIYVIDKSYKRDETWNELFQRFNAAREELKDYEMRMRYKEFNNRKL